MKVVLAWKQISHSIYKMLKISFRSRTHNLRCGRNDGKVHNFQGDKKDQNDSIL